MSDPENPNDQYSPEIFEDSIDDSCRAALGRLRSYKARDFSVYEPGDKTSRQTVGEDALVRNDVAELFSATFSLISAHLVEKDQPADYFRDIVAHMLALGLEAGAINAGNSQIHLVPSEDTLKKHIAYIWQAHEHDRLLAQRFTVYSFNYLNECVSIDFVPDGESKTWSIGYGMTQLFAVIKY